MSNSLNFISDGELRDPIITNEILNSLTPAQNEMLKRGRMIYNPISGDLIVPVQITQTQIARIVVNLL